MPKIIVVRCNGPNRDENEVDLEKALTKIPVMRGASPHRPDDKRTLPQRIVIPCRYCSAGKVIIDRAMMDAGLEGEEQRAEG